MSVPIPRESDVFRFQCDDNELAQCLYGPQNQHLQLLEKALKVTINVRGAMLHITGDAHASSLALRIVQELYDVLKKGRPVYREDVDQALRILSADANADLQSVFRESISIPSNNKVVTPRSQNQRSYLEAMRKQDLVFAIGPAGTGKTFLAVAMAIHYLMAKKVNRIILARPAVEAGENLGFLPGDIIEKINPYLRPLYDALYQLLSYDKVRHLMETDIIEIAPLAFMRGRTLNSSFIILDEAQNCTVEQMKMLLTRIGFGSRAVVAGDVTQTDLPEHRPSGLLDAEKRLKKIPGIAFQHFTDEDVVRHELVSQIVRAYDKSN